MTVQRLRETRSSMMTGWPSGGGWTDPAAIPPPGLYSQQRAGVPVTVHTALQVDAVFTALRVVSNSIIKMRSPRAYTEGYDRYNRPYWNWLLPQPSLCTKTWGNKFQFDGTSRSVVSLALFGEAFWLTLTRDKMGYATALEVLNPAFVTVNADATTGEPLYYYGGGVNKVQLATEDVTHIPFLAMPDARRGLSSIEYAGVAYALALAAMEYGQRWFAQGASPSFILSTDQKLGVEEVERIAKKFLISHGGLTNSHLPLVVDSNLKVEKTSSTPDEAQYLNTLQYARSVIAAWFGLPDHLVGGNQDKPNVWGKTLQEQNIALVEFTLSGYTIRMEEAYESLLPGATKVHYNDESLLRAAAADAAKEILSLRTATVKTGNDIRIDRYHMPPVEGGDDLLAPLASNSVVGMADQSASSAAAAINGSDSDSGGD